MPHFGVRHDSLTSFLGLVLKMRSSSEAPLGLAAWSLSAKRKSRHLLLKGNGRQMPACLIPPCLLTGWSWLPQSSSLKGFGSDEEWVIMGDRLVLRFLLIGLVGINPGSPSRTTMCQRKLPNDELPVGLEKEMGDNKIQELGGWRKLQGESYSISQNTP